MALTIRHLDNLHRLARRQPWLQLFLKFIDNLRIDSKEVPPEDERGSKLQLWNTQRLLLEQLAEGMLEGRRMFYLLKGRQQGASTLTLALLLFWVAIRPRTIAALVTNNEEVRNAFRDSLERYMASFPKNFFGDEFIKSRHNENSFIFSNGSRIDYLVAGKNRTSWGESRGYSVCLCTEVADYGKEEGLKSFIEALAQTNPDRWFMFESTAKGPNHWQSMWYDAADEVTIGRIFTGWWAHELNLIKRHDPRYAKFGSTPPNGEETELCNQVLERFHHVVTMEQLAWWRWKLANSDRQAAEQNQPWLPEQAFVLSGYSFFQTRLLQKRYDEIFTGDIQFGGYRYIMSNNFWAMKLEPIFDAARLDEVELRVWEEPIREAQYAIGCDPAFGHSDDSNNHAISVWRCYADKMVQVAEYADSHYETKHCAWILAGLAAAYRNCMVNLELFGPGRLVMHEFDAIRQNLQHEMYMHPNRENKWDEDFMAGARWYLHRRIDQPGPGFMLNFETTAKLKWELFNLFRDCFTSDILVINSAACIEEMNSMIQQKTEIAPQAPGRQHDDRPFAAALAVWAWEKWLRMPLVAAGATYERVSASERGERTSQRDIVDRLVYSYFQKAEAEAAEVNDNPYWAAGESWRSDRGFM